jgi:two-component system chemotaxis response regulator CheB
MIRVLIVDDSALARRVLSGICEAQPDMRVEVARDGIEALGRLHQFQPDVVTLDVNMPSMDGLQCLDRIMLERPCPVVMVSSMTEAGADVTLAALQLGAVDFIVKPSGTVSLAVDELAPILLEKLRAAASGGVRLTARLSDRIRRRLERTDRAAEPLPARRPPPGLPAAQPDAQAPARAAAQPGGQGLVLVGTSTGGPPALDALLAPLPADFPWPLVVAQHMPAAFTGPLARRLDRLCALSVLEVTSPCLLAPGHVYIAKGEADIVISARPGGCAVLAAPPTAAYAWHPSVDRLVASAMAHLPAESLIGVLMTGMGNDGAASMARLHKAGGRTIAEAEETAIVWGMPGELVRAGGARAVAPLHRIPALLLEWAR